jgi:PEP-CTERM motif
MRTKTILGLSFGMALASNASTVLFRPPGGLPANRPSEGIPYDWVVTMGGADTASMSRHVGAWSWEDNALFDPGDPSVGWTHTSDWVRLELQAATSFTMRLERQVNVAGADAASLSMFPSFTLWSGWDQDGVQNHTYNNNNNAGPVWAEDLAYLDHVDNSTLTSVERTWSLAAGQYTIVLGSNAPATDPNRQGYLATLTTVPEPSSSLLVGLAGLGLVLRRRR